MKLLLVGATGLVGSHVLRVALLDQRIDMLIAPVRRALPEQPRLLAPIVDFDSLPEDPAWWQTMRLSAPLARPCGQPARSMPFAVSITGYPLAVAKLAKRHGTPTFVLNSAIGANPTSRFFYNRVKGEVEQELGRNGLSLPDFRAAWVHRRKAGRVPSGRTGRLGSSSADRSGASTGVAHQSGRKDRGRHDRGRGRGASRDPYHRFRRLDLMRVAIVDGIETRIKARLNGH